MSDGEKTGSEKKPHYTQIMKDEIAAQKAEIEALRAQLAAQTVQPVTITEPETEPETPANEPPADEPVVDPLAWITKKTKAVFLVSSTSRFVLRHENPRSNPPTKMLSLAATAAPQPWAACPFDFRSEDRIHEQNNRVMLAKWHHLMAHSDMARIYWDDPRFDHPDEAVIDPKKFRGWNPLLREANGEKDKITEFVPLRELVRYLLQKNGMTFMDWSRHQSEFDPRFPNPYRNKIPDVGSVIKREVAAWGGKVLDSRMVP
jgi:hypothetical protein